MIEKNNMKILNSIEQKINNMVKKYNEISDRKQVFKKIGVITAEFSKEDILECASANARENVWDFYEGEEDEEGYTQEFDDLSYDEQDRIIDENIKNYMPKTFEEALDIHHEHGTDNDPNIEVNFPAMGDSDVRDYI